MENQIQLAHSSRLNVLPSGDPGTAFHYLTSDEILSRFGPPGSLLSTSVKVEKCLSVGVYLRVLFLTPGIFCPGATRGCLRACLGHTSGRMHMPTHAVARDRRAAQYLENPALFMARLTLELAEHCQEATRRNLLPAIRLNASSDLPWEEVHPEIFAQFPQVQFFDYTKVSSRMEHFVRRRSAAGPWPENYYLTFSATPENQPIAQSFLAQGRNVTTVFWPELPLTYWGLPVIDGDNHDARFLDPQGVIVGLRAKGSAQADLTGFTVRTCPACQDQPSTLRLIYAVQAKRRTLLYRCPRCGFENHVSRQLPRPITPCRSTSTLQ